MDSEDEPKADQATKDEGRLAEKLRREEARKWSYILLLDSMTCLGIFPFSFTCIDIDETNTLLQMVMWNMDYTSLC